MDIVNVILALLIYDGFYFILKTVRDFFKHSDLDF
ncbi:hypothetical protein Metme_4209 [Methylomonas methanica MC09]|uniref:Uncharacterized protein n=1 Tax=Methylomonas methanica (strain DSM 25384 / MC09) TaxID=857087 RepID=G0A217_METMM|nr:hypothetical protein Metme_4209 [Methylomonas methanica MC09]